MAHTDPDAEYYLELREGMVKNQLEERGLRDPRVLDAMRRIPRHSFVPEGIRSRAYDDTPLPLGEGQTISQPYMVAWMTELLKLKGDETVLEIGTGTGYQAAVLGLLARDVYTVERIGALAESAAERLRTLGLENITVVTGDGTKGLPEHAPYQGIIVTAGSPQVPQVLAEQLIDGGRLVIPVGSASMQVLTVVERHGTQVTTREEGTCVFVPLVGKYGWKR